MTASYISPAELTQTRSTPKGASRWVGPLTRTTRAPASAAASATAYPIFPELKLLMKRTGSSASRVAPAVTMTLNPLSLSEL